MLACSIGDFMCNNAKEKAAKAIANLRNANNKNEIDTLVNKLVRDIREERKLSDKQIFRHIYR